MHLPVRQSSCKMILNVVVHDGFEVLEFTVLQQIDDMYLHRSESRFTTVTDTHTHTHTVLVM